MFDVTQNKKMLRDRLIKLRGNETLESAAKKIGIDRTALGYYESGKRLPGIETLLRISNYYNVTCDYLLGLTDVKEENTDTRTIYKHTGLYSDTINTLHNMNTAAHDHNALDRLTIQTINWLISSRTCLEHIVQFLFFIPKKFSTGDGKIQDLYSLELYDEYYTVDYSFATPDFWGQAFFAEVQKDLFNHRAKLKENRQYGIIPYDSYGIDDLDYMDSDDLHYEMDD